jgi:hypothetical protein
VNKTVAGVASKTDAIVSASGKYRMVAIVESYGIIAGPHSDPEGSIFEVDGIAAVAQVNRRPTGMAASDSVIAATEVDRRNYIFRRADQVVAAAIHCKGGFLAEIDGVVAGQMDIEIPVTEGITTVGQIYLLYHGFLLSLAPGMTLSGRVCPFLVYSSCRPARGEPSKPVQGAGALGTQFLPSCGIRAGSKRLFRFSYQRLHFLHRFNGNRQSD